MDTLQEDAKMSLDFSLVHTREDYSVNYTHNVIDMWVKAGCYDALYKSQGFAAANIIPFLVKARDNMEAKPEEYKAMNPKNGWGDYDTALSFTGLPRLSRFYNSS
jgi:hypothetical protein